MPNVSKSSLRSGNRGLLPRLSARGRRSSHAGCPIHDSFTVMSGVLARTPQNSTNSTPSGTKCFQFSVATVRPCTTAVAAIKASLISGDVFALRALATSRPHRSATSSVTALRNDKQKAGKGKGAGVGALRPTHRDAMDGAPGRWVSTCSGTGRSRQERTTISLGW
jgi:hypothetical protein